MSDLSTSLTRKVGPLPVWTYGVIVALVAWAWYAYSKSAFGGEETDSGLPGDNGSDAGSWDEYFGDQDLTNTGSVGNGTGGSAVTPGSSQPSDNQAWFRLAADYLVGFGYEGVNVSNALTKYLTGVTLTLGERALVSLAIGRFGLPPEGVPVNNAPPPVDPAKPDPPKPGNPTPATPTSSGKYVTVTKWPSSLSTLWGIAQAYLGNGSKWRLIWDDPKNSSLRASRGAPERIRAGDKFWVPGAK